MSKREKQTTAIAKKQPSVEQFEKVLLRGNLIDLTPDQRISYYKSVCESVGLNPITRPFEYIEFSDDERDPKLELYARKNATDQLRQIHVISVRIIAKKIENGMYIVTAQAETPDGRIDEDDGVTSLVRYSKKHKKSYQLSGEMLANALMKTTTKAKRRVTLSICGLSLLDESEIDTIPNAQIVDAESSDATRRLSGSIKKIGTDLPRFSSAEFSALVDGLNLVFDESKTMFEQSDSLEPAEKKDVSKLFKQARSEPDLALRAELYRKATALAAMCPDIDDQAFFNSIVDAETK